MASLSCCLTIRTSWHRRTAVLLGGPSTGKDETREGDLHRVHQSSRKGLFKRPFGWDEWVVSSNPNWAARRHHQSEIRALKRRPHGMVVCMAFPTIRKRPPWRARSTSPRSRSSQRHGRGAAGSRRRPEAPVRRAHCRGRERGQGGRGPWWRKSRSRDQARSRRRGPKPEPKVVEPVVEQKPGLSLSQGDPEACRSSAGRDRAADPCHAQDGEVITVKATGGVMTTLLINQKDSAGNPVQTPSIQCKLSGGFIGTVIPSAAAARGTATRRLVVAHPPWRNGANVSVTLRGRLQPKTGKVVVLVESVKAAERSLRPIWSERSVVQTITVAPSSQPLRLSSATAVSIHPRSHRGEVAHLAGQRWPVGSTGGRPHAAAHEGGPHAGGCSPEAEGAVSRQRPRDRRSRQGTPPAALRLRRKSCRAVSLSSTLPSVGRPRRPSASDRRKCGRWRRRCGVRTRAGQAAAQGCRQGPHGRHRP